MADESSQQTAPNAENILLEKFEAHREFAKVFLDAFMLITAQKKVVKFNQAFCTMLGLRAVDVKRAQTLDDLVRTEIQGSPQTAVDLILTSTSTQRIDEVQAFRQHDGAFMQLIVSSFPYLAESGELLGCCVLMRDVTAESSLQGKYQEKSLQSITDPLSGLFTRRYFEEWIDKECERCKRNGVIPAIGLLMFDLDKFKNINDTYGHQAGDYVIATTAKILKECARKSDIIGRYGGEEILVLLVGTTLKGACIAAEKFRQAVQSHEYVHEGKRIPVTTSVGVSFFLNKEDTRTEVVKRADECLYQAKHNGRNVAYCDFGDGHVKAIDYMKENEASPNTNPPEAIREQK
jgi:diguanylate cyclase (GGDEF)-like protein/PAS domain S-box-containing protein